MHSIHPGFIWTPMVQGYLEACGQNPGSRVDLDKLHPLGHVREPEDIVWGAVYLVSDEAKFVPGAELAIDGGYTAR